MAASGSRGCSSCGALLKLAQGLPTSKASRKPSGAPTEALSGHSCSAVAPPRLQEEPGWRRMEIAKASDSDEDPPIVKLLKEVDDRYREIKRNAEEEDNDLDDLQIVEYKEKMQKPFLEKRRDILTKCEGAPTTGTPALKGFWLQALKNHPQVNDVHAIREWDEAVLDYIVDVETVNSDSIGISFKIIFKFLENPYFSHTELVKEWRNEWNPCNGDISVKSITATEIEWKAGMNVTVTTVQKNEEPRPSFFRTFFRKLNTDMTIEDLKDMEGLEEYRDIELAIIKEFMDRDHAVGNAIRDEIIPFAVRWYTGEAAPDKGAAAGGR